MLQLGNNTLFFCPTSVKDPLPDQGKSAHREFNHNIFFFSVYRFHLHQQTS